MRSVRPAASDYWRQTRLVVSFEAPLGPITASGAPSVRCPRWRDVLVVTRLDRLARSTRDLLNVLHAVAERGAGFKSLKDAWCDTTTPHGRLMLTVLGGLAEFERELIRARTGEGRKRAQQRGVRFGRPRKLTPHQRDEALHRLAQGETQADIARTYNVDPATISRLAAASPFEHGAAVAR
jgi:DNA invertase Pin-like site-specific DNA recombinase